MSKYVVSLGSLLALAFLSAVLLTGTTGCPASKTNTESKKSSDGDKKSPTNERTDTDKPSNVNKDEKKLTLLPVSPAELKRGMTLDVKVTVKREKFNEPVRIAFDNLPKGVTVETKELTIARDADSATFQLKAGADAELSSRDATVTATWENLKASETFKVTVKDAK